jgi:hypothetical protein
LIVTNLRFILEEGDVGYALYLFDRLEEGWEFGELIHGQRLHLRGPKKHPLDYLEHFHWAVESEDSLIGEAVRRWGASVFCSVQITRIPTVLGRKASMG